MLYCMTNSGELELLGEPVLLKTMAISKAELAKTKQLFIQRGFIDENWVVLKWKKRQESSDRTAAQRMRRLRERQAENRRNVTENVTGNNSECYGEQTGELARVCRVSSVFSSSELDSEGVQGGIETPVDPALDAEYTAIGKLAIELSCDLSLGAWVGRMAKLGHSPEAIKHALEQGAITGKFSSQWLAGILKRIAVEGIPPPPKPNGEFKRPDHGTPAQAPSTWSDDSEDAKRIHAEALERIKYTQEVLAKVREERKAKDA